MSLPGVKSSATLQSVTVTQNATTGKNEVATATVATFDAAFHPISASEELKFNKETVTITHKLRVEHRRLGSTVAASLIVKNQIIISSITYDIAGVVRWPKPLDHYRVHLRATDVDN